MKNAKVGSGDTRSEWVPSSGLPDGARRLGLGSLGAMSRRLKQAERIEPGLLPWNFDSASS